MIWKKLIPLITALSVLALQACGAGVSKSALEETIAAGIAQTQTMESGLEKGVNATLTALAKGAGPAGPDTPTATLAQALTTQTYTPGNVTVSVSVDTWCSKGPGLIYDKVFILYVGQTAEVIGKDEYGTYWVIKKPDNPAVTCWLWGKYATITGDASKLPVIAPPPTPTAPLNVVTAAAITVSKSVIHSGDCHFTQSFTVTITTSGPATVKYDVIQILQGGGQWSIGGFPSMIFNAAGTQGHQGSVPGTQCGTWVYKVVVSSPNSVTGQTSFKVISP
jgi:hypothetical protein